MTDHAADSARIPDWLDDAICDAYAAAKNGQYDGLTATEHLEHLIERVRVSRPVSAGGESNG